MRLPSPRLHLLLLLFSLTALCAVAPFEARADVGTYSMTVPTTSWPGWWSPVNGGPFRTSVFHVDAGVGSFAAGEYRRWRLEVPDGGMRLAGGRIRGKVTTPNDDFVLQLREGSDGGAVRTLYSTDDTTAFDRGLVAGNDWVEFGLFATRRTTTTVAASNAITVSSLSVMLRDDQAPTTTDVTAPDQTRWYGPAACAPWSITTHDSGSGLWTLVATNETSTSQFHSWKATARTGLAPGARSLTRSGCLDSAHAAHGMNVMDYRIADYSGQDRLVVMKARFDLQPPVVTPPADIDADHATPRPEFVFTAVDANSGIGIVTAAIDGEPATTTPDAHAYRVEAPHDLAVGSHTLNFHVVDIAGNSTSFTRAFRVVDQLPPEVTIDEPGSEGTSTPWLAAHATDVGSSIDPSTWRVRIDGVRIALPSLTSSIEGSLGLLTSGVHEIEVSVADTEHNRTTLTRSYLVVAPPGDAPASSVGSESGVFIVAAPTSAVTYQTPVRLHLLVAQDGRPFASYRVHASIAGRRIGSDVTDARGVAVIEFLARRPGTVQVVADGTTLNMATTALHVAPRITLNVASAHPRVGSTVRVRGRVAPTGRGRRVALQARIDGIWYPLRRSVRVSRRGTFSTTVVSAIAGPVAIRVRLPGRSGWSLAYSNTRVLHVHR